MRPSWSGLHQQAIHIKQNLYISSLTWCKIQLCRSGQNLWKPVTSIPTDSLQWGYLHKSDFLDVRVLTENTFEGWEDGVLVLKRATAVFPRRRTDLILGSSHIGVDGAFLLLGVHLPLPAALGGACRWHTHGGRSLILWGRRQRRGGKKKNKIMKLQTQSQFVLQRSRLGLGCEGEREEHCARLFGGFRFVYGAALEMN